jgi:hypothetical protein
LSDDGEIIGYTAARRPASKNEVDECTPLYKELVAKENQ